MEQYPWRHLAPQGHSEFLLSLADMIKTPPVVSIYASMAGIWYTSLFISLLFSYLHDFGYSFIFIDI